MRAIVLGKVAGLLLVLVLLLWGLGEISGLVQERQGQRQAAVASVAQSLAGAQTLLGPVVHMACTEEWQTREGRDGVKTERREFTRIAPPATLTVIGANQLEPRARGLHATQVFTFKTQIRAEWPNLDALKVEREHADSRISCGPPLKAELELLGGATQITLRSNWPHPSFNGQFLPSERTVTDQSFDASGRVSSLASTAQHAVQQQRPLCDGSGARDDTAQDTTTAAATSGSGCTEALGMAFIDPANTYALSHRATRYGRDVCATAGFDLSQSQRTRG